ncbi:MAG: RNA-directed DNA polymerase [Nitrospinaceae bacterium]|nr:RNA-directed DNA polymerase [Nitrospinaceae bacterium]
MREIELLESWGEHQAASERWLISDPLIFSEFDVMRAPPARRRQSTSRPEVDFLTRPKQSGGIRLELIPDVFTSNFLQAAANRIVNSNINFGPALSVRSLNSFQPGKNTYDKWSSSIITWIRNEISQNRVIIITDIHNYYGSISEDKIENALKKTTVDFEDQNMILSIIKDMNTTPYHLSKSRQGLPIAPNDFFWIIADLVLAEIDREIQDVPGVLSYARWIDDFFISVKPINSSFILNKVESIFKSYAFTLNTEKTTELISNSMFDREYFTKEHNIIDTLFLSSKDNFLPVEDKYIMSLIDNIAQPGIQESRIIKRVYSLSSKTKRPCLLNRCENDLRLFPTAELSILEYLGHFQWSGDGIDIVKKAITSPYSDSRQIGAMRALLRHPPQDNNLNDIVTLLVDMLNGDTGGKHPFFLALSLAFLLETNKLWNTGIAVNFLDRVPGLGSAMARRISYEILFACCDIKKRVRDMIASDPSPSVRGLLHLVDPPFDWASPSRLRSILSAGNARRTPWGEFGSLLAQSVLPSELLANCPHSNQSTSTS